VRPTVPDVGGEGGAALGEPLGAVGKILAQLVDLAGRLTDLQEGGRAREVHQAERLDGSFQGGLVLAGVLHGPSIPFLK